jgi:uncharacterized membrane protein
MNDQSETRIQLAVVENVLAALTRTLLSSHQDKAVFCQEIAQKADAIESSPPGRFAEYTNEEREEISARLSNFTMLIR